jgi:hypothetical protein
MRAWRSIMHNGQAGGPGGWASVWTLEKSWGVAQHSRSKAPCKGERRQVAARYSILYCAPSPKMQPHLAPWQPSPPPQHKFSPSPVWQLSPCATKKDAWYLWIFAFLFLRSPGSLFLHFIFLSSPALLFSTRNLPSFFSIQFIWRSTPCSWPPFVFQAFSAKTALLFRFSFPPLQNSIVCCVWWWSSSSTTDHC